MGFTVEGIPVWRDNYAWLLVADDGTAAVVDSPEAAPVLSRVAARGVRLTHVLNTHHHPDHVGSNDDLAEAIPGLQVWAGVYDVERGRIPGATRALGDGERFHWGGAEFTVFDVPGHTLGHIAYLADTGDAFVGDTLFAAGCGRLFEGTAVQLDQALNDVVARWPASTRLHCAHEYTASNVRFALTVDGDNPHLLQYAERVALLREAEQPTVPTTVEQECRVNPFLRCDEPALRAAAGLGTGAPRHEVLGALRKLKDDFRG